VSTKYAEYDLYVYYRDLNSKNIDKSEFVMDISEGFLEPFNVSNITSIKEFLAEVAIFEFRGANINILKGKGIINVVSYPDMLIPTSCSNWTFSI